MKLFYTLLYIIIFYLIATTDCLSQTIQLFEIDTTNYPVNSGKFIFLDNVGTQIKDISSTDFYLRENGIDQQVISVTCPSEDNTLPISAVIAIDRSSPRCGMQIIMSQTASSELVRAMNSTKSECAIMAFDSGSNSIYQKYTNDKDSAYFKIDSIECQAGQGFSKSFLAPDSGAIAIAKNGKYNRIIVYFSNDGVGDEAKIISEAKANNITIYCIITAFPANNYLKHIAEQTGGLWFENIISEKDAILCCMKILQHAKAIDPCTVQWNSTTSYCITSTVPVDLTHKYFGIFGRVDYRTPSKAVAHLKIEPATLAFRNVYPGEIADTTIMIDAINGDFNILDIISSDSLFSISPANFHLNRGESKALTIHFKTYDYIAHNTYFTFITDLCYANYYVTGNYTTKVIYKNNLKLTSPNGKEIFAVGSDTVINWEGVREHDTVKLEYSSDGGNNWKTIVEKATGFSYKWKNLPTPAGDKYLIRISLAVQKDDSVAYSFIDTFRGHKGEVTDVNWSPDGTKIVSTSYDDNTMKVWNTFNGNLIYYVNNAGKGGAMWSPDGKYIGSYSGTMNAQNGNLIYPISGVFSPDSKRIISISSGNNSMILIRLYELEYGDLIKVDTSYGSISYICWTPSSSKFIIGHGNGRIDIFNGFTGDSITTFVPYYFILRSITMNPFGTLIAEAGGFGQKVIPGPIVVPINNEIRIFDIATANYVNMLYSNPDETFYNIAWSPDGTRIILNNDNSMIKLFNVISGKLIYSVNGVTRGYGIWSPDGTAFATIPYYDRINYPHNPPIKIWDAQTGNLIYNIDRDKFKVSEFAFSPDWSMISMACWDSTVKVMYLRTREVMIPDISDTTFSIVSPEIASTDIDMKQWLVGSTKDSIIQSFITNTGKVKCRIDSIYFEGNDASQFHVVSGTTPFTILPGKAQAVKFSFSPTSEGIKTALIKIISQADSLTQSIQGEGVLPHFKLGYSEIDFGRVQIYTPKDTNLDLVIKNISSQPFTVTKTIQLGPDSVQFSIKSGGGSFTLEPDSSRAMKLTFAPTKVGSASGSIGFYYNGVGSPAVFSLLGRGFQEKPKISIMNELNTFFLMCGSYSTDSLLIQNNGSDTLKIKNIQLTDQQFTFINSTSNIIILPDSSYSIKIKYVPINSGPKLPDLIITSNSVPDSLLTIHIIGYKDSINIAPVYETYNLGSIKLNTKKDTTILIKNLGSMITGASIRMPYRFTSTTKGITLYPDSIIKLKIHFAGSSIEETINDSIKVIDSLCGNTRYIHLQIRIYGPSSATLQAGTVKAYAGETVEIPIYLKDQHNIAESGVTGFKADLSYNASLLVPVDEPKGIVTDGIRTIPLNIPMGTMISEELTRIKFIAALGNDTATALTLSNIIPISGKMIMNEADGVFSLLGVCHEGGDRLINADGVLSLTCKPNPVNDKVQFDFETIEDGYTELFISDMLGNKILKVFESNLHGKYYVESDLTQLYNGVYAYTLLTPTARISKLFVIDN